MLLFFHPKNDRIITYFFQYFKVDMPCCSQIYNLFHLTDPCAVRIEPLLCKQFTLIEPCMIPRYSKFPLGDGSNLSLGNFKYRFQQFYILPAI